MAQIFPRWSNKLPAFAILALATIIVIIVAFFWYFGSPKYTDVGYRPDQPIPYSHKLHAGDLGLDCRYCHYDVEYSAVANIPPTQVCLNCHRIILPQSDKLQIVRDSYANGKPIQWLRAHKLPDYVYFDHSIHLHAGVGCSSCHGNVAQMEIVSQSQPLSMSWCLDCHRHPNNALRPIDQITNMNWAQPQDQNQTAAKIIAEKKLNPPENCSGCHR
jgi:hypothetical protein